MPDAVTKQQLVEQLQNLGVKAGGVLVVHTSYSKIRPIIGGPQTVINALQTVLTPQGTLVMPSMTWDDETVFDPQSTPCPEMGIVADTFWRQSAVFRSDNAHAFAALGPYAAQITAPHPLDIPHGLDSPVGRIFELDGQVLLLGVGQSANTTIHLAENMSGVRYRRQAGLTILKDGKPTWFAFEEVDHCCQNFRLVDGWLAGQDMLKKGIVGHGAARLMNSQDIVNVVVKQLQANETAFLHPYGVDEECDEARDSIPESPFEKPLP